MDAHLSEIIPCLTSAVETILNPCANQAERLAAHKICEDFKEMSPLCIECGVALSQKHHTDIIRHFGLQLLEHVIKFKWHNISEEEKDFLKKQSLEFIANGTADILEEASHIKDAVSRITVELIKREWPQLWQSLQKDLYDLCQLGVTQTELVMKTYLRLAEDVVTFSNLPAQRRRDVSQSLTARMGELFELFILLLQDHTNKAALLTKTGQQEDMRTCEKHLRVSEAVLATLTGYLDWVSISTIFAQNNLLLQILCLLVNDSKLQLHAADCLLIIVSRKGKIEDRQPLMILFSEDAMSLIWGAAMAADKTSHNLYYYLFLKKLCQVLTELGKQLCAMWGQLPEVGQPPNFGKYLEAVLAFTQYPSQMLSSYTQTLWAMFLRHEFISKDPVLQSFIPRLFESATQTLRKVGFPTQNNSPSCDYARVDFDSDEEFNMFFSKYRSEIVETLRLGTMQQPAASFAFVCHWVQRVLQKPVNTGQGAENGNCKLASPSFIEWDAMTICLESVMCCIRSSSDAQHDVQAGITLLSNVLQFQTEDPLILSSLLSCISALFSFVNHTPNKLPAVLEKIFPAVTFNLPGQTKATRSKAVKSVRQHACSILVKICKDYPHLLFPAFDQLYNHIQVMSCDPEQLSQMEKCILTEALIIICNKFHNFDKQSSFAEEVLRPVKDLWLSEEFKQAFWSPVKFMSYVGLDQAPVEPSSADTCGINRSHSIIDKLLYPQSSNFTCTLIMISYCLNTILALMKRSKWPEDLQVATDNGFVLGHTTGGKPIYRNPATAHITILLENLLALIKTTNLSWQKEYFDLRHPDFSKSYDLMEVEKLTILGIPPPCVDNTGNASCKQPLERMQLFLHSTHETCCHILGNAGQCLGYEFYTVPKLVQSLLSAIFTNLDNLPDYRVKPIIRAFVKPYIQNCPKECYQEAVIPMLMCLCPYMYRRLGTKWQQIAQRNSLSEEKEENQESQEVLEDQLTTQLTREYIELLGTICHLKRNEVSESEESMMEEDVVLPVKREGLSDLGKLCMRTEDVYPSIMLCLFSCLSWNDTVACTRASNLCLSTIKQLLNDQKLTSDSVQHFFCSVMFGLQIHGEHEAAQPCLLQLGLQIYELLRPHFPDIRNILLQIPNCTQDSVKSFDDKILSASPQKQFSEKKKKEAFKKMVIDVIGKSIGQQFKKDVHYQTLPPIFCIRPKQPSLDEVESKDLSLCQLFNPTNGNS